MTENIKMTEQEQKEWVRAQYLTATKYLAEKGLTPDSVFVEDSRYLTPLFSVWKIKLFDKTQVWVICGDLPTDHVDVSLASTAREIVRHFSLKWQLQADNLLASDDKKQVEFANILINRAEGIYQFYQEDSYWQSM